MRDGSIGNYTGIAVTPGQVHAARIHWITDYLSGWTTSQWITDLACTPLPTDPARVPYRWWYRFTRDRRKNRAARVAPWRYTR